MITSNYNLSHIPPFIKDYDPFIFGHDHRPNPTGLQKLIHNFIVWENRHISGLERIGKIVAVFFVKLATALLCIAGIGIYITLSYRKLNATIQKLESNAQTRLHIVAALGGNSSCSRIPTVNLNFQTIDNSPLQIVPQCLEGPLLKNLIFQKDMKSPIAQGLDPTGRCYLALEVINKETVETEANNPQQVILYQSLRETDTACYWRGEGFLDLEHIDQMASTINLIVTDQHPMYKLNTKE